MTIQWCDVHQDRGNPNFNNHSCWKATSGDLDYKPCRMVEMRLVPTKQDSAKPADAATRDKESTHVATNTDD